MAQGFACSGVAIMANYKLPAIKWFPPVTQLKPA